jgi:GDP-4-dehydro-6-deoxy-D-mannose reductase
LNKNEVADCVNNFKPDFLLHLASISSVGHSWKFPQDSFVNNTNIFLNLIEQIRLQEIPCRILSIGSSEEYGNVTKEMLPLREDSPLNPISPYAVARVSQEMISKIYEQGYGMDIIMTRSFNHIGPGQKDIFVIPSFAKQLVGIKLGKSNTNTITTGDLNIIRDFIDVRDVVNAYYMLLMNGKKGEVYNICSGDGTSLHDIILKMCDKLDIEVNLEINPQLIRPNDNKIIIGNSDKLRNEINWNPQIELDKSIEDILDFWTANFNSN